jgi:hypothetical protein
MTYKILSFFFLFFAKDFGSSETKKQVQSPVKKSNNYFCRRIICNGLQTNDLALPSREGFMEALKVFEVEREKDYQHFNCEFWLSSNVKRFGLLT